MRDTRLNGGGDDDDDDEYRDDPSTVTRRHETPGLGGREHQTFSYEFFAPATHGLTPSTCASPGGPTTTATTVVGIIRPIGHHSPGDNMSLSGVEEADEDCSDTPARRQIADDSHASRTTGCENGDKGSTLKLAELFTAPPILEMTVAAKNGGKSTTSAVELLETSTNSTSEIQNCEVRGQKKIETAVGEDALKNSRADKDIGWRTRLTKSKTQPVEAVKVTNCCSWPSAASGTDSATSASLCEPNVAHC